MKIFSRKMLIKNIAVLLVANALIIAVALYLNSVNDNYATKNAIFVVGMFMLLIGIATITKSFNIFNSVAYVFNKLKNKNYKETYYDYVVRKGNEKSIGFDKAAIVYGLILIVISLII